jgi:hypothetical protein
LWVKQRKRGLLKLLQRKALVFLKLLQLDVLAFHKLSQSKVRAFHKLLQSSVRVSIHQDYIVFSTTITPILYVKWPLHCTKYNQFGEKTPKQSFRVQIVVQSAMKY